MSSTHKKSPPVPKSLSKIVEEAIDRRDFLHVTFASACGALLAPSSAAELKRLGDRSASRFTSELFQFTGVPTSQRDAVVVPEGYVAEVLYRWGDPINGVAPRFQMDASDSAADQELQAGMGHDGMEYFAIPGVDPNLQGILCVNHEYTDQVLLFSDGLQPMPPSAMLEEKVRKSQAAHGISIVEIARQADQTWKVIDSPRARRLTANTPLRISGPASELIGTHVLGTLNNCAAGRTPWGTYLKCEENFQGVFGTDQTDFSPDENQVRYGLQASGYTYNIDGVKVSSFRWWQQDRRFDLADPDNDSLRFGYVVEVDPLNPKSVPVKRTALGRFRHENAELTLAADRRVVVYMGDDQADEYIYKYVSRQAYDTETKSAVGVESTSSLLDDGTLYVARFDEGGRGEWLELSPNRVELADLTSAEIAVFSRQAATLVGATPMDRPEWVAVHPVSGEVFVSLTNNKGRSVSNAANPRSKNIYGHIVRWQEDDQDAASLTFRWKVFVLAGNAAQSEPAHRGTINGDSFACPDGLKFDSSGILWIQTDVSSSVLGQPGFEELGNNMMLAADPSTGEIRRFLTGPLGCEITGNAMTPDRTVMFVNIQHPGEPADEVSDAFDPNMYSQWPDGSSGGRPRSATIVVRRLDGRPIGS
ncbi:MAG TPA: PhoX family phosphatase [Pirellulaceae bacterium]|nr:PhoX family phosphatase [Pirellulaceae bacterium]HMO90607.1 PhoX family phosphatase [Pirellulaceae bacterium]HMP67814.1 PhoX family phosphatase [Pirellulaceae bacterium]